MTIKNRIDKTKEQLMNDFHEQVDFICEACKLYDSGKTNRIKMAASHLRTLFYKQRYSEILIDFVDIDKDKFVSSIPKNMSSVDIYSGPIFIDALLKIPSTKLSLEYFPKCYEQFPNDRICSFQEWWNEPIIKDQGSIFSRRNIIDYITNQDGGAHVDPSLKKEYVDLIDGVFSFQINLSPDKIEFAKSIQLALLRQIAHETIQTFILQDIQNIDYNNGVNSIYNNSRCNMFNHVEFEFEWLD